MPAHVINIAEPAHDDELNALRFLAEGLPAGSTLFTNPWLMQPNGAAYELDAIVVVDHAIFIVEIKGWRGHIHGGIQDWFLPKTRHSPGQSPFETRRSPLLLARKTAQILHTMLSRKSHAAGQVWVQELLFLPNAASFRSEQPGVERRVALRNEIHDHICDPEHLRQIANRRVHPINPADRGEVESTLIQLLQGTPKQPPLRHIAGFEVIDQFDSNERYREVLGRDTTEKKMVLRIYHMPWDASEDEQKRLSKRATWEAGVLRSFARAPEDVRLPMVEAPVELDDGSVVVPMEHFEGQSLPSWLAQHGKSLDLNARVSLWVRIARALAWTHKSGVVHRQLRPECVLLLGEPPAPDYRLTGFELAKRQGHSTTVVWSDSQVDALEGAAPEVMQSPTNATPASDQFSLGLLLAYLVLKKPLVERTLPLIERRHRMPHLRDVDANLPQRLDDAVARMLQLKPAERYPSVKDAIAHVQQAVSTTTPTRTGMLTPGTLIGSDFLVEGKLGAGGLSDVYKVKHQLLGERYALKVARPEPAAEHAIQCEYHALRGISHHAVVRAHGLSKMVEDRITVQLDLVPGLTLTDFIRDGRLAEGGLSARRRLGIDLLDALDEFERIGLSHNDLKPDNLMVRPDGRLVIIDFSLARSPAVEDKMGTTRTLGGTFEWRDPSGEPAGHTSDRYAAAMCLFWLHAGRHPFDGRVPEPGVRPDFEAVELEPEALEDFFHLALDPSPQQRYRSSRKMREDYLKAFGVTEATEEAQDQPLSADTRLSTTSLSNRASRSLAAAQIHTVGEVLALGEDGLARVPGLGPRLQARVAAMLAQALEQGVAPTEASGPKAPPFFQVLAYAAEPLSALTLDAAVVDALSKHGLKTVGDVASSSRTELQAIPNIGPGALTRLAEALVRWQKQREADSAQPFHTLDSLWARAAEPLSAEQQVVLEALFGFHAEGKNQSELAAELGIEQPTVSARKLAALKALDTAALDTVVGAIEGFLELERDILPLSLACERLTRELPTANVRPEGLIHLLAELDTQTFRVYPHKDDVADMLTRPWVERTLLSRFADAARGIVTGWPPEPTAGARRTLRLVLPEFQGDHVLLAQRLLPSIQTTTGGALFMPPVSPDKAALYALEQQRDALSYDALQEEARRIFGDPSLQLPPLRLLPATLKDTAWQVQGSDITHRAPASTEARSQKGDDARELLAIDASIEPRDRVRDVLRGAGRQGSSFRLVVVPPKHHHAISQSLVTHLGAQGIDLAAEWFSRHEASLKSDARAARIRALQVATSKKIDSLVTDLINTRGEPGQTTILYNTGILASLGGLEQIRLLYDRVQGQAAGFWIVVIPGVILERRPLFNEQTPVWHQPGLVLPLAEPLRA